MILQGAIWIHSKQIREKKKPRQRGTHSQQSSRGHGRELCGKYKTEKCSN